MSSKRHIRKKACGNKRRYETQTQATTACYDLNKGKDKNQRVIAYKCKFCKGFHFGHPPKEVKQALSASYSLRK